MIPALAAAQALPAFSDQPIALVSYIIDRLGGRYAECLIDRMQLDVVVHTAEVFDALATGGPQVT